MENDGLASSSADLTPAPESVRPGARITLEAIYALLQGRGWIDSRPGFRFSWIDPREEKQEGIGGYSWTAALEIEIKREPLLDGRTYKTRGTLPVKIISTSPLTAKSPNGQIFTYSDTGVCNETRLADLMEMDLSTNQDGLK